MTVAAYENEEYPTWKAVWSILVASTVVGSFLMSKLQIQREWKDVDTNQLNIYGCPVETELPGTNQNRQRWQ
jgi:hypothetical protein